MQVRAERRQQLAFRWILLAARGKKGKPMAEKLAAEILAAAENQGDAVKKKQDVQRMAEANRAFAHFAR
jgi:small subunit ribosomal protein S7